MKKYYVCYKITNKVDGKIYIGVHKTSNINDNYLGSGKLIKEAVKEYGTDVFDKEILYVFEDCKLAYEMELCLVNDDFIKDEDTYNIRIGGIGGWSYINGDEELSKERDKRIKSMNSIAVQAFKEKFDNDPDFKQKCLEHIRKMSKMGQKTLHEKYPNGVWYGKRHSEDSKKKIGEANSIHQKGSKNSQYGTCWIYNETDEKNMKIKKEDIDEYINNGWKKGRKMSFSR
jgi:hypothetical protein